MRHAGQQLYVVQKIVWKLCVFVIIAIKTVTSRIWRYLLSLEQLTYNLRSTSIILLTDEVWILSLYSYVVSKRGTISSPRPPPLFVTTVGARIV